MPKKSFQVDPATPGGVATGNDDSPYSVAVVSESSPPRPAGPNNGETATLTGMDDPDLQKNLYLYEEDMKSMPSVSTFLKSLAGFGTVAEDEAHKLPKKAKLGVILGVYLPTIQHIFGVLMFVRLAWIVGHMGIIESFFMVLMCCITTFVTAISMSAIATNGMVQAGGSYFMISRNLGPECGGAVGICFYLANTFASDLYILGAIEIFLQYIMPGLAFFGDIHENPMNNYRVYGTIILLLMALIVAFGIKFVQMFAPFSLICVIISIICIFIGSFESSASTRPHVQLCMLGDRLLIPPANQSGTDWCSKNSSGSISDFYCKSPPNSSQLHCDEFLENNNLTIIPGIPGMASGVFKRNLFQSYLQKGEVVPGVQGFHHQVKHDSGGHHRPREVVADLSTSFVLLCAIYFPSVTGIMTGSNMSGDLRDPQKSIPIGTIMSQLTCSFVYLSFVLLFGATSEGALLRDKFGKSQGGHLLAALIAWPSHWVVLIGGFCSTLGAALQCLTSAPRLLQAIASDNIIPFLKIFQQTTRKNEPLFALLLTIAIAEVGILIASLDHVAPLIDVCFLMCYAVVNMTCALQTLLKTPNWRPRFKYYHWSLSFLGVVLNLALSIMAGWYFALTAFLLALFIYKYIEYKGGEKEWGDGMQGLSMVAAQQALLKLEESDPHTKNWRPQLLLLTKLNSDLAPKYPRMLSLASQLKAGKGLTIVAAIVKGEFVEHQQQTSHAKLILQNFMVEEKVKGFSKVLATSNITEGLKILNQTLGLGGMRHNTVMIAWPCGWHATHNPSFAINFLDTVRHIAAQDLALLVPRNLEAFPTNKERMSGTIDIWWIVHDGGMLILLSFLLKQHKVWKNCSLRLFTVAQISDNSIKLKKDLETFLYQLRINAEVYVEEMYDNDISAYTVERTLDMEKRSSLVKKLRSRGSIKKTSPISGKIQEIMDQSHRSGSISPATTSSAKTPPQIVIEREQEDGRYLQVELPEQTGSNHPVHFTFSPSDGQKLLADAQMQNTRKGLLVAENKLMRMHTAVKLNSIIKQHSSEAAVVIMNFPAPPAKLSGAENYMEYLEALTEKLVRVLLVRGSGKEVVTIYS